MDKGQTPGIVIMGKKRNRDGLFTAESAQGKTAVKGVSVDHDRHVSLPRIFSNVHVLGETTCWPH